MRLTAYRQLDTWQIAMTVVEECYKTTQTFPREELYGLTAQMRRAAVSIPANIAEGYCRRRPKAYLHHVSIAMGSHAELETLLEIAARLRYVEGSAVDALDRRVASIGRLLHALHRSLEHMVAERNEAKRRTRT